MRENQCDAHKRVFRQKNIIIPSTTSIMPRTPLGPISGNRVQKKQLTPSQRGYIEGVVAWGATPSALQKKEGIPESTGRTTLQRAPTRNNNETKARSGRPELTDARDRRHIWRAVRENPRITYKELIKETGVHCGARTLYRLLKEWGLKNWIAKKRPLLTAEVAAKRLKWCRDRQAWELEQWLQVIWSDECSVERGTGKGRPWVIRFPHEKWKEEMIAPYPKSKGVRVMVWGGLLRP